MTGTPTAELTGGVSAILDLVEAFRRSKTMFTAVGFGVFDRLHESPASAAALSDELQLEARSIALLLDSCVSLGLLIKSGDLYRNTPESEKYLRRNSPDTLAGYILYSDRNLYPMWGNLASAIREGTNRWQQTFGGKGALFNNFFATEESKREFLAGMHGLGLLSSPLVVDAFDLGRFRRLIDLGGATGHLALAAANRYPKLTAAVFDLAPVTSVTREYVGERVEVIAGDFFEDTLPEADLFALGRILHDWSDETCASLLSRIHAALPSGGGLLIAEKLVHDDRTGPRLAMMQSLNMLICAEGKERTLAEYTALLKAAGFSSVDARITNSPLDAILALK